MIVQWGKPGCRRCRLPVTGAVRLATYHKPAYGPGLAKLLSMYSVHESKAWDTPERLKKTSGLEQHLSRFRRRAAFLISNAQRMRTNPAKLRNS